MKPGKGKEKGSGFERAVAKRLSLWLTQGKDSTQLIRSVLSGGWKSKNVLQVGDLAPNGEQGEEFRRHFAVECKHRNNFDLFHIFTQAPGENLLGWWSHLDQEIRGLGLDREAPLPFLAVRANYRPILVGVPPSVILSTTSSQLWVIPSPSLAGLPEIGLLPLDDFLKVPPEEYYQHISGLRHA